MCDEITAYRPIKPYTVAQFLSRRISTLKSRIWRPEISSFGMIIYIISDVQLNQVK